MSSSPVSADGMLRGGDDGSDIESDCTAVKGSYGTGVASVATNDGFGADTSAADPILFQPTCRRPGASTVNILQREHDEGMVAVAGAEATEPMSPCSSSGGHVLDEVLLLALKNRQDRLFLLRLDRKYCDFIQDKSRDHMEFPWLNSYYRLMIHRTADYFGLGRQVDVSHKRIRVFKTEHSTIPTLRFCDLVEHDDEDGQATCPQPAHQGNDAQDAHVAAMGANVEQHQVSQPEPQAQTRPAPTKVLKRSTPTRPISACESRCGESFIGTTNRRTMVSMEQREKAYAEARARIFCEEGKGAESFMGAKDQCTVTMEQKAYAAATVQVFGEDGKGAEPSASALDRNSMVSTEQQEQAIAEAKTRNIGENGKGKAKAEHQPVQQHHHTFAGVIGAQEEEAMTTSHLAEGCGRFALGEEIERTEAEHEEPPQQK
ncbi:cAMP-regulated phosphoprotein 21 [Mortierella sp. GBA43]|nr:cAMP-regulated phosphoprotein 21 [Mortierella sp. GBA43]